MNRKKWNERIQRIRQRLSLGTRRWIITVLVVLGVIALVSKCLHEPLGYGEHGGMSGSIRLLRDFIILAVAGLGLWIAGIRSLALQKQAEVANKEQSSNQLSRGIALLGTNDQENKPAIEVRVGALYALEALARANPEEYGAPVMKILVSYIRNNIQRTAIRPEGQDTAQEQHESVVHLGEDTKTAFASLKRLHDNILHKCGLQNTSKELSFAYADFRRLRLDVVEWIGRPNLSHANLSGSNLARANLSGANLEETQLEKTNLWEAKLSGAKLARAELSGANLEGASLSNANLMEAQLSDASLARAKLPGANLAHAKLSRANFTEAILFEVDFNGVFLMEKSLKYKPSVGVDFSFAQLSRANFSGAWLWGIDFKYAQLVGVDFRGSRLFGANLNKTQLSGATFHEATQMECTSFEGSNFDSLKEEQIEMLENDMEELSLDLDHIEEVLEEAGAPAQIPASTNTPWKIWHSGQQLFTQAGIHSLESSTEISQSLGSVLKKLRKEDRLEFLESFFRNFVKPVIGFLPKHPGECAQALQALSSSNKELVPQEIYDRSEAVLQELAKNAAPP